MNALFETDKRERRIATSHELMVRLEQTCPWCNSPVSLVHEAQPALFKHAGYGETLERTFEVCVTCKRSRETSRESASPLMIRPRG